MSRDPSQGSEPEPAHDVLAAEAFAVPTSDPELRAGKLELPVDPSGIAEPHDILAAEEFAMPAAKPGPSGSGAARRPEAGRRVALVTAAGAVLALLRLRRRR